MLLSNTAISQVAANFTTVSSNTGCGSLIAEFQDLSTGNPDTWLWDFGNGNTSTQENPIAIYSNPGNYDVTLTVSNSNSNDSRTSISFIKVFQKPIAEISSSSSLTGCSPLLVDFQDISNSNSLLISWQWDFGDGGNSLIQNPDYQYLNSGNFHVSLLVIDTNGCEDIITINNYVFVEQAPQADFLADITFSCNNNELISFSNNSINGSSFFWDFGDGNTSNLQNPTHNYSSGLYSLELIAGNSICFDTLKLIDYIEIGAALNTSFISDITSGCEYLSVNFFDSTENNPDSWEWDFGDGNTSNLQNPSHIYLNPGVYDVSLTTNKFGQCLNTETVFSAIEVFPKPFIDFFADTTYSCSFPFTVQFIDSTLGSNSWQWDFGNGLTSSIQSPSIVFDTIQSYDISLIVSNINGCLDTLVTPSYINIDQLTIDISNSNTDGCMPFIVNFLDNSSSLRPIDFWEWDFGDGNTSSQQNPTNEYINSGIYDVSLSVRNDYGCFASEVFSQHIIVTEPPNSNFQASPITNCTGQSINFTDLSSSTSSITGWYWDFGDGFHSTQQNPIHQYHLNGIYNVTLVASVNGCSDTLVLSNYVNIKEPTAIFSEEYNCNNPLSVDFTNISIGADSVFWDFGDGTFSTQTHPTHIFPSNGIYDVRLQVYNISTGCFHEFTKQVEISTPEANFTYLINPNNSLEDSVGCRPKRVYLENLSQNYLHYKVIWEDGYIGYGRTDHLFDTVGTFDVTMVVTDQNGCKDTFSFPNMYTINDVKADFTINNVLGCDSMLVSFQDLSFPTSSVKWDFGDGGVSIQNNPQHIYYNEGFYDVTLYALSEDGCRDTLERIEYIQFQYPVSDFLSNRLELCPGDSVQFSNNSTGFSLTSLWDFGDGNSSNLNNPSNTYILNGLYDVSLTVIDSFGCSNELTISNYIRIENPDANFSIIGSSSNCPPLISSFSNQSTPDVVFWLWDFGDGNFSSIENPTHLYSTSDIYDVSLIVVNDIGCSDTLIENNLINISGPVGFFNVSDTLVCSNDSVNFIPFTQNSSNYFWDFGDGFYSTDSLPSHYYSHTGSFFPSLVISNNSGCQFTIQSENIIYVRDLEVDAGFDLEICIGDSIQLNAIGNGLFYNWIPGNNLTNNLIHNPVANPQNTTLYHVTHYDGLCTAEDSVLIYVHQESPNPTFVSVNHCEGDSIEFLAISGLTTNNLSWNWSFGSSIQNPIYQLPIGSQEISLIVQNLDNGCIDSVTNLVEIFSLPEASFSTNEVCIGDTTIFQNLSSNTISWYWDFGDGIGSAIDQNTSYAYMSEGIYFASLLVIDTNGCKNYTEIPVKIHELPLVNFTVQDICENNYSQMNDLSTINEGQIVSWIWNFGDGSSEGFLQNENHMYNSRGIYDVTLRVISSEGCIGSHTKDVIVFANPIPLFKAENICIGDQTYFSDFSIVENAEIVMWEWDFGDGVGVANYQNPNYHFNDTGSFQISLTATSQDGCKTTLQESIRIYPLPIVEFSVQDTICLGSFVNFNDYSSSQESIVVDWEWDFGDGFESKERHPKHFYNYTDQFNVSLKATSLEGCFDILYMEDAITVIPVPKANFSVSSSGVSELNSNIDFHNTSSNASFFYWDFGNETTSQEENPSITFLDTGTYLVSLSVENNLGCLDGIEKEIFVYPEITIYIPNSFTPNNDGINDIFILKGHGIVDFQMQIFDRWGGIVFRTNDLNHGWDGKGMSGSILNPGIYTYNISINDWNKKRWVYNGELNLMK